MYQQSCEEYKHQGKSSGSYWIDPDGSGPIAPFRVSCDMTGEIGCERDGGLAPFIFSCDSGHDSKNSVSRNSFSQCSLQFVVKTQV